MKTKILIVLLILFISQTVCAISADKTLHYSAGIISYYISDSLNLENPMGIVLTLAASKEIYDHYNNGTVEFEDIAFTLLGGLTVFSFNW